MYKAKFVREDEKSFLFSPDNNLVFDIEGLSGLTIDHTLSQGVNQIGETVSQRSVGSRILNVTGVIFKAIATTKKAMRDTFLPFSTGKLIFNDSYYIDVFVKEIPNFSPQADRGNFSLRLLAPYPFFKSVVTSNNVIGGLMKNFHFPINYTQPHSFGTIGAERFINIVNRGNVETDFVLTLTTTSESLNPSISNLRTFETLKINYLLSAGETIRIYFDGSGTLQAKLVDNTGNETDIFSAVDESSDLLHLHVGDNLILAVDESGSTGLTATLQFNESIVGVFDQ